MKKKEDGVLVGIRFHFLDLVLGVAVVAFLLGAGVLIVAGGTFLVLAAGLGGAVEVVFSDTGDIALGGVGSHVQRVQLSFHHVWLEHIYRSLSFPRLMVFQSNKHNTRK